MEVRVWGRRSRCSRRHTRRTTDEKGLGTRTTAMCREYARRNGATQAERRDERQTRKDWARGQRRRVTSTRGETARRRRNGATRAKRRDVGVGRNGATDYMYYKTWWFAMS